MILYNYSIALKSAIVKARMVTGRLSALAFAGFIVYYNPTELCAGVFGGNDLASYRDG